MSRSPDRRNRTAPWAAQTRAEGLPIAEWPTPWPTPAPLRNHSHTGWCPTGQDRSEQTALRRPDRPALEAFFPVPMSQTTPRRNRRRPGWCRAPPRSSAAPGGGFRSLAQEYPAERPQNGRCCAMSAGWTRTRRTAYLAGSPAGAENAARSAGATAYSLPNHRFTASL